jgi:hypothetical protein
MAVASSSAGVLNGLLLTALLHSSSSSSSSSRRYPGPGPGAWEVGVPSEHGLDAAQLAAAARRVAQAVPYRHCFVAVKDGKIMHELCAPPKPTRAPLP